MARGLYPQIYFPGKVTERISLINIVVGYFTTMSAKLKIFLFLGIEITEITTLSAYSSPRDFT